MLHDVAIIGAGPVGATLALALAGSDVDIVVLDARARGEPARGDRSIALSHGARLILERAGVWSALCATHAAVTPITTIDISQAGGFGLTRLHASEQRVPALGYVVSYRELQRALDQALDARAVRVRWGARVARVGGTPAYACASFDDGDVATARLAVVADGSGAAIAGIGRYRVDYRQVALVARLSLAVPHGGVAYERFSAEGPLALLPEGDGYGLVWTSTPQRAEALVALSDGAFVDALKQRFGTRATGVAGVGERRTFPLALEIAASPSPARCVAIGNAAQTLHPVAGQGYNLGLRDAQALARALLDSPREAIGSPSMLDRFLRSRRTDRFGGIAFTHGLLGAFGSDVAPLRWSRGIALTLLDMTLPAKRVFTAAMLHGMR